MLAPEVASGRRSRHTRGRLVRDLLVVTAGVIAVAAVVGVGGDFPLADDWSYAYTTRALCQAGRFDLLPWSGSSLILQAAYGALLCKAFGLSFVALRISTLAMAALGTLGFAMLLRTARVQGRLAGLALVLFAFNPLYLNLSFTFMTDVPFVALMVWAAYFYTKGLGEDRTGTLLAGSLACAASILVRQHGIFVAVAAFFACLLFPRTPMRRRTRQAVTAVALPSITLIAVLAWMFWWRTPPAGAANRAAEALGLSAVELADVGFRSLVYLGLFALPLSATLARPAMRNRPTTVVLALTVLGTCAGFLYLRQQALMPYLRNVLYDFGLGPWTLRDVFFLGEPAPGHIGLALELPLTVLSIASAAVLAGIWVEHLSRLRDPREGFLIVALIFMAAGTLLQAHLFLDRHLLPLLPLLLAGVATSHRARRPGPISIVLAACLAWYSVAGTHDYLAWNRARWHLLEQLEDQGITAERIDGGVEYNAWRLAARLGTWPTMAQARVGHPRSEKSWWWVIDDDYRLVTRLAPGEREVARADYPVLLALPPSVGTVYVAAAPGEAGRLGDGTEPVAGTRPAGPATHAAAARSAAAATSRASASPAARPVGRPETR